MTILGKRAFGGLAAPGLGQRRTPAVANPITGTGPSLGAMLDGDTLDDVLTRGSYSSTAGDITEPVDIEMQLDGGEWEAYVGSTAGATGGTWRVRENPSDGTNTRTFTSNAQTVQPLPATVPSAFTSGQWTAVRGNALIAVTVSELPDDGGSDITAIQYRLDGGSWVSSSLTGTGSFNITGRTNGVEYGVELRAVNAVGDGAASDVKAVTPATVPGAPSPESWEVIPLDSAVEFVIHSLPAANGSAITKMQNRLAGGTDLPSLSGGVQGGLTNGQNYNMQIRAVNDVGAGAWAAIKAVTPVAPIPVPENVTPPAITGDLIDGEELSLSEGTWTPTPDEVERQWLADASPVGTSSTLDLTGREGETISARTRARMTGGDWSDWEDATGGGEVQPVPGDDPLIEFTPSGAAGLSFTPSLPAVLAGSRHFDSATEWRSDTFDPLSTPYVCMSVWVGTQGEWQLGATASTGDAFWDGTFRNVKKGDNVAQILGEGTSVGAVSLSPGWYVVELLEDGDGHMVVSVDGDDEVSGGTVSGTLDRLFIRANYGDLFVAGLRVYDEEPDDRAAVRAWAAGFIPEDRCALTSGTYDAGGGNVLTGYSNGTGVPAFGSKDSEPIAGMTFLGMFRNALNSQLVVAFSGDQATALAGKSVYLGTAEAKGTWTYYPSGTPFGVPATMMVVAGAGAIPQPRVFNLVVAPASP